ncbi:hypothetical protein MM2B1231_3235 [Mycobacteroides abscessus subsp. bolletii 2B-1231]|uniref:Uncharacterized protein n=1 Tax=Mycobacteroides abscessus MAB_091912_2446 TaxID=1335414 RepID=A0A829MKW7_9MYCO|nr:hypothetical protein MM1S1510930_3248 [Mycobacteroides abscessus subsp. bolletii 1S-151-0930]EIU67927.1 hypothetical protein MM1S1520914_3452 [Mycobacteroides abscessus subsp. bolletii 1S-152-0914]EIU73489.1 hypothetical protein MM1S1530915_2796 [Mycobacteroides abscessus subsp. bolletii 1S-153-0915]EIU77555.1 hypothetical protein MM2B0626_3171 [Mycobacteroides abscessus subsp. bolletii 2B-0626]EIV03265.1 hypothetical protein MM2B0912R_3489 [Mycobacteroides abscessus subsp. bolletii 2B-0912-
MLATGASVGIAVRNEWIGVSPYRRSEYDGRGGDRCDGWNEQAHLSLPPAD